MPRTLARPYLYKKIDLAATGEIIAAVAGHRIVVMNYTIVAAGTVTATWESASTALSGAMPLIANSGVSAQCGGESIMATAVGEALNLALSAGVQVSGHLTYYLETPDPS